MVFIDFLLIVSFDLGHSVFIDQFRRISQLTVATRMNKTFNHLSAAFSVSIQAQQIISKTPYHFPDRSSESLQAARTSVRLMAEPLVERVLGLHGVRVIYKMIGGIKCLVVQPKKICSNKKILYGFGGGFVMGSAFEDLTIAVPISALTNLEVIIPEYRLAPEHPWPAACDDFISVYAAISDHLLAVVGESAGGNLVLVTLLRAKRLGLKQPEATVLLSPWCDLTNDGDSLIFNEGRDPTLSIQQSKLAALHYAVGQNLKNPEISPLFGHFDEWFPKVFISSGTRDLLLSQSIQLASVMQARGISVDLRIWEGLWHVFEWNIELPEAVLSINQIAKFLINSLDINETK